MKLSISRSQDSIWAWLFWGLGTYLVLELGPFFLFGLALKKTAAELLCPYIVCAMPGVIFMPLVWWSWQREKQGPPPKQLAREWGVSAALWGAAAVVAVIYSGVKLGLMDPKYAFGGLVVSLLLCVPIGYITLYHMTLSRISSRAAGERGGSRPKQHLLEKEALCLLRVSRPNLDDQRHVQPVVLGRFFSSGDVDLANC